MESKQAYWFVGALWDGKDDQTERFLNEGIWENGYKDKHLDEVNSIQPGDKIAIKAAFTQKKNLPFQANGSTASVMAIKARGTVTANEGNGKTVHVDWEPLVPEKRWYFFTHRGTVWRLEGKRWLSRALIDFTFNDADQDYNRFRNAPYWKERFGDNAKQSRFPWTEFYEELATKLVKYQDDRGPLVDHLHSISQQVEGLSHLNDRDADGNSFPLADICPFTLLGTFNRQLTDPNRRAIAAKLAAFLDVDAELPANFDAIPVLNNQKSWFFAFSNARKDGDIDKLWEFFAAAIAYADGDPESEVERFAQGYDAASTIKNVGWNLTMGLYWIRPWVYLPLDGTSQQYIKDKLNTPIPKNSPKGRCSADDYFQVLRTVEARFEEDTFPVHSFPELSFEAWRYQPPSVAGQSAGTWKSRVYGLVKDLCLETGSADFTRKQFQDRFLSELTEEYPSNNTVAFTIDRNMQTLRDDDLIEFLGNGSYRWTEFDTEQGGAEEKSYDPQPKAEPYGVENILNDGCFLSEDQVFKYLSVLKSKQNLVLQGAPGTGKTWLAKRLAYALIGHRIEERVRAVQFHPNLSYEDFIRGWRPGGNNGVLELVDGPFLEMVYLAQRNPENSYVLVIEEINRGNPAQIFGEMLTLLEKDKRTPNEALELTYGEGSKKRVYIPKNLYVIGTMNIADRSLALVDLALRRRFAFIDLKPQLGERWRIWAHERLGSDTARVIDIEKRFNELNQAITDEPSLGAQFQVGHSYVTPTEESEDVSGWFLDKVETEIYPLLQEYFFDAPNRADELRDTLLEGW
ncbi:AAA family ATPase [Marinobacterium sp. YM272]|uniref:AAA family ATPase n=1 Tax=Marinobacterium sp. YM272 TaxID=3421654 RepID=UPI003D7F5A9A